MDKHLFTQEDGAERIKQFAAQYSAPVWVAMEYRYMPPVAALIDNLDTSTGGARMLTIREHRFPFLEKVGDWNRFNANSGGTFVEKCCHFFDLMRLILKSDPVRVMASGGQVVNHLNETYDPSSLTEKHELIIVLSLVNLKPLAKNPGTNYLLEENRLLALSNLKPLNQLNKVISHSYGAMMYLTKIRKMVLLMLPTKSVNSLQLLF